MHVNEDTFSDKVLEITPKRPKDDEYESPKTILGSELPEGRTKEEKRTRRKYYLRDALIFAIIIPILDYLLMLYVDAYKPLLITNSMSVNYVISLGIDFVLIFITTYIFGYIFGEISVKKKNK